MIRDIEFGKWLSIKNVQIVVEKHLMAEDIHIVEGNREANKFSHKFYEEILPIYNYANFSDASEILFVDDTKNGNSFDGMIKITDGKIISIECTNAILPEDAKAQKERDRECNEKGYAELSFQSIEANQFRNNIANIIREAIQKKIKKSQKSNDGEKYKDFHLIVTLIASDFIWSCENDVNQAIEKIIKPMDISPFAKVVFYNKCETGYPKYAGEI